jgi:hypothetical protein
MNFSNPLEILLTVLLVLGSLWIIERIIAGAFKTVVFALVIVALLGAYTYKNHYNVKPLPKIEWQDFTDSSRFEKKYGVYAKQTVKDIREDYSQAKKNLK